MQLTDSHLHFDVFAQEGTVDEVIRRAADRGVERMVAIGGAAGLLTYFIGTLLGVSLA